MDKDIDIIEDFNSEWWSEVYNKVYGGVVFIDNSCAECLHWNGGLHNLFDAGAVAVKELSSFESGNEQQKKAVFITGGTSVNLAAIQTILTHGHFVNCVAMIAADSNVLQSESNMSFTDLEDMLNKCMKNPSSTVEVIYTPLFSVAVSNNMFVTPSFSKLYPKFGESIIPNQTSLDLHSLTSDDKESVRRLATCFNSLFEYIKVKEDIFYMGPFSSILSGVLEHLPEAVTRRKNVSNQASIIFIDRTIDLGGVTSHSSSSFLDKMMNVLPRLPGHSTDLAVDISPLCDSKMISVVDDVHLCPGCVIHPHDENCKQIFDYLVNKSQNEIMLGLYNKLVNVVNVSPNKLPQRVTAQNLEKIIAPLKGNYDVIKDNSGLLQQTLSVIQTLKSPELQQIDLLHSLEKQIVQSITTSRDSTSLLSQMSIIIKSWKQRGLSIERILSLLVHIYSLAGGYVTFSEAQEKVLSDALSIAVFEDQSSQIENIHSPEGANVFAQNVMNRLRDVAKTRDILTKYKSVIKIVDKISPSEYRGVLQQLVSDLVDVRKPEIPDLKCRTSGLKDLLKSGLSMLMSTSKSAQNAFKHPFDNPTVIIYVVGGITVEEYSKMHHDIMISGTDVNVIIGSTSIVNSKEAMRQALFLN